MTALGGMGGGIEQKIRIHGDKQQCGDWGGEWLEVGEGKGGKYKI